MSFDTEHVRNAGDSPSAITGLPTFTELCTNTDFASLYTAIRHSSNATGPELVESVAVSKKTVYEYLHKLEQAGLIMETGEKGGASVYDAVEFELTLTIRDVEVSVTPALVAVIAHATEYPVIGRVRDDHGLVTFALAYDLVRAHSEGDITSRQIARLTGLSSGTTYDLIHALYEIEGLGDDDTSPTTYTPAEINTGNDDLPEELPDQ